MLLFGPIVCAITRQRSPPPLSHKRFNISKVAEWPTTLEAGNQKVGGITGFWAGSERYTLRAISEANINFLACFFFKHKLHLILPKIMQKNSEIC